MKKRTISYHDVRMWIMAGCRPCYDSAPTFTCEGMTESEYQTLKNMIGRYLKKVRQRHERAYFGNKISSGAIHA